jgi:hypothetical protein
MKTFTDADVVSGELPYIYCDLADLVDSPLWWQKQGSQQTATGYGHKLAMREKISFNGKSYRLYCTCFSNAGSAWFVAKGRKIWVD